MLPAGAFHPGDYDREKRLRREPLFQRFRVALAMDFLNHLVSEINSVLWGVFFLVPLLCGTGIFYTFKLRFVQIRKFGLAARYLFGGASFFGKRATNRE